MNLMDFARAFFARTWKFFGLTALTLAVLVFSLTVFGVGGTVGLVILAGAFALVYFKGDALYSLFLRHVALIERVYRKQAAKLNAWWTPVWEEITGEVQAVADARAELRSAKAAYKAAKQEEKAARKLAETLAEDAAKALKATLLSGEDDDAMLSTIRVAEDACIIARDAAKQLKKLRWNFELAKENLKFAAEYYRDEKSDEAVSSV